MITRGTDADLRELMAKDAAAIAARAKVRPEAEASQPQESDVSAVKKTVKAAAKATAKAKPKPPVKAAQSNARTPVPAPKTKLELIVALLKRPEGCTTADVLQATGWPAVSMPQQAKAAKLKLRTAKEGRATRYWAAAE